jgi:DNA topoisomerase-1
MSDPEEAAPAAAPLRYVSDAEPGLRRRRRGRGFSYTGVDGSKIEDAPTLARIRALAIPPAWRDVWICPFADGHLQATGRDARGRKQYRYNPQWREVQDQDKFSRLAAFGAALPRLRRRVRRDLRRPGIPREKILAAVVRLLDLTGARVGNEEYRRANDSFGLTTLRDRHATVAARELKLSFRGKGGAAHEISVRDPRLVRIVLRCQELPGQRLFQYLDSDGEGGSVDSADVNDYLRALAGSECSAKDFRTWHGSVAALAALRAAGAPPDESAAAATVVEVVDRVAKRLRNTRAVCRKYYIHPALIAAYLGGSLGDPGAPGASADRRRDLSAAERDLLAFLG